MKNSQVRASLVVISVALATVMAAIASINLIIPDLAAHTRASQTTLTWVVDSYSLCFALLLLPGGWLGDRFGRRRLLIIGLLIFALASIGTVLASGTGELIAGRVLMGVGAALVMPATLATITATFPVEKRDIGVTVWVTVTIASAVVGLVVNGLVLQFASYRWTFLLNVALAVVALVGTIWVVPESRQRSSGPIDVIGALLSVAGLAPIVYSIIEAPERGWDSGVTIAGLAAGSVLLAAFVGWELRIEHPLLDPRIFRSLPFTAGTLSVTFQFAIFFGFVFVLMQVFQSVSGYSAIQAGMAISPAGLGAVVGAKLAALLGDRPARWLIAPIGLGLITGGMVGLALSVEQPYVATATALLVAGIGLGVATTVGTTAITDGLSVDDQGVASAVNDLAREVGGALGLAVVGSVLTSAYRASLHLPAGTEGDRARDSFAVATTMSARVAEAGRDAFISGARASYLAAALIGAVATLVVSALIWAERPQARRGWQFATGVVRPFLRARLSWGVSDK